jgi:hypothetical protein
LVIPLEVGMTKSSAAESGNSTTVRTQTAHASQEAVR